jgi:glutathione S-transferase
VHSSVDVKQALEDKSAVDIENDHTSSAHLDLFGRDLGERAITEMWNRRMELEILEPIANAFRHRVPLFANRLRHDPQYAEVQRTVAEDHLAWLDQVLADRPFIAGDHFSVADITAFCGVDFGRVSGISVKPDQADLLRWFEAVAPRPNARA